MKFNFKKTLAILAIGVATAATISSNSDVFAYSSDLDDESIETKASTESEETVGINLREIMESEGKKS